MEFGGTWRQINAATDVPFHKFERVIDIGGNLGHFLHKIMTANPKSKLMIGECSIPDPNRVGVPSTIYKIDLQMMNLFGDAMERTPQQWKDLMEEADFSFVTIHPTRSLTHFVVAVPSP